MGHQVKIHDHVWDRATVLAARIRASSPVPGAMPDSFGAGDVIRAAVEEGLDAIERRLPGPGGGRPANVTTESGAPVTQEAWERAQEAWERVLVETAQIGRPAEATSAAPASPEPGAPPIVLTDAHGLPVGWASGRDNGMTSVLPPVVPLTPFTAEPAPKDT